MNIFNDNYRYELKFLLTEKNAEILKYRLTFVMDKDMHSVNPNGEYFIRSLYFDDIYNTAYKEKNDGIYKREKYRIRCYNCDDSYISLEMKGTGRGISC